MPPGGRAITGAEASATVDGVVDRGAGRPVVLVHGQPGDGSDWAPLVARLEDTHRVLAPDRPGWGASDVPAMGFAGNADWLEELLAGRVGAAPVLVVGHSFGGGVALELALRHPARVRALVLLGSVGHAGALSRLDRILARPVWGDAIVRTGTAAARRLLSTTRRALSRVDRAAGVVDRVDSISMMRVLSGAEPLAPGAPRSFSVEQRALVDETAGLQARLGAIEVPTLVVVGTRDLVVGVDASRALAGAIPGAELAVLPGAGHLLPLEVPRELAEMVRRYDRIAGVTA